MKIEEIWRNLKKCEEIWIVLNQFEVWRSLKGMLGGHGGCEQPPLLRHLKQRKEPSTTSVDVLVVLVALQHTDALSGGGL